MEKIVKVTNENYPELYDEKLEKYLLMNPKREDEIIGTATINHNAKANKINVTILEEYRSNGYGKFMFQELLKKYETSSETKELRFEVMKKMNLIVFYTNLVALI